MNWHKIKNSKYFYIYTYRRINLYILFSLGMNCLLAIATIYIYMNQPERDCYTTTGIIPPARLTAKATPNYSDKYLLPPEKEEKEEPKILIDLKQ